MTEQQWLTRSDPERMLRHVTATASPRKLRLFGAACVRRIWPLPGDDRSRRVDGVAERFADGQAGEAELADA